MSEQQITSELKNYIITEILYDQPTITLTDDFHLIQNGIISSLQLFKMIDFIQQRFQIKIQHNEIILSNFESLSTIRQLIQSKL